MIDQAVIDDCTGMVLAVAPELAERPFYLVDAERLAGLPHGTNCYGWADGACRDANIAERLGDEWQGPGALIVLDGTAISEVAAPGGFAGCCRNVAIHEAAHLFPRPPLPTAPLSTSSTIKEFHRIIAERQWTTPNPEPGEAGDVHDLAFARRCVHLFVRACKAGYDVPLSTLLGGGNWQSGAEHYLPPCLPEAMRMIDEPIAAVEAISAPAALVALWEHDLKYFHWRKRSDCNFN